MKLRSGFVANSSSSSFVIFVSREVYDAVMETLSELQKRVVSEYISFETKPFMGKKIVSYSYFQSDGEESYRIEEIINSYREEMEDDDRIVNNAIKVLSETDEDDLVDKLSDFAFSTFENLLKDKAEEMGEGSLADSQSW